MPTDYGFDYRIVSLKYVYWILIDMESFETLMNNNLYDLKFDKKIIKLFCYNQLYGFLYKYTHLF
jgi:hypothetical protein